MTGAKVTALRDYCRKTNRAFLTFEYRGLLEDRYETVLSDWIQDALSIVDFFLTATDGPKSIVAPILVGSSMGAWIAIQVATKRKVAGMVTLGAAVDFTVDLEEELMEASPDEHGFYYRPSEYSQEPYPISQGLLDDARENWLLMSGDKFQQQTLGQISCPVHLIHGKMDHDVSWKRSALLADRLVWAGLRHVETTFVEDGDHRLSRPVDLKRLVRVVNTMAVQMDRSLRQKRSSENELAIEC